MRGGVYISRSDSGGYLVQISVEYRYANYANFNIGDDKYAAGWRDTESCVVPFHTEMIRFPE